MKDIVIATDNTLGIPAGEIDDGLALLYLLGCQDRVCVRAICTTHGNASTELTNHATHVLAHALHPLLDDVPILRGADAPRYGMPSTADREPSAAARLIAKSSGSNACLLSLGATTDLAAAETLRPGALAGYASVALMGGTT